MFSSASSTSTDQPGETTRPWRPLERTGMARALLVALAAVALLLAGCGSDDSSNDADPSVTTTAPADGGPTDEDPVDPEATDPEADPEADPETLVVLVSNDDGYDAPGIDALVEGLLTIDAVEVIVVAPSDERSGTGGNSTEGPLEVADVELASGHPARAVDGFPADTIRVAIDELGIEPHVVITGINAGQNLGPIIDISGTVGAARAAATRGIPALATSQGMAGSHDAELDFTAAVSIIVDWVHDHRQALLAGDVPAEVTSLNVPSCGTDPLRGLAEVEPDPEAEGGDALLPEVDCTSTVPITELPSDVEAFNNGYATIGPVPTEPWVTRD